MVTMMTAQRTHVRLFVLTLVLGLFQVNLLATGSHRLLITEFLALNGQNVKDEDGEHADWIELYNPGETAVNLSGWSLTDKKDEPHQWVFPALTLNPGDYLLVYASGKDKRVVGSPLHTNFKLAGGGEYLALLEPDSGLVAHAYDPFPAQQTDVSYGLYLNQPTYFRTPTPGEGNTLGTQVQAPRVLRSQGVLHRTSLRQSGRGRPRRRHSLHHRRQPPHCHVRTPLFRSVDHQSNHTLECRDRQ